MIRATAFVLPRLPPASPRYDFDNEQKFRKLLAESISGVMRATNDFSSEGTNLSLFGWSHSMVFSATDENTVAWTSGSILLRDGTTYAINAGNTGNIAATTYVFLDIAVSETVLQTTTTASAAVGLTRILVAVAKNVAAGKDAQFQVMGGADDGELVLITADIIAANTITANEIAANTITAAQIAAGTITATQIAAGTITANEIAANTITGANIASLNISTKTLVADTGTIGGWSMTASTLSADAFTLTSGTHPRITLGAATAFGTGAGVFLGRDVADDLYKMRIGHPTATPQFAYNGATITLNGASLQSPAAGSSPSLMGWTHDMVFSATDHNTVAWSSGTITLQNGATYAISSGNTGNMAAPTYIFLDQDVSSTVLQTTTTASNAVGHNRILVAVANDVASGKDAMFQVFGGADPQKIELIVADIIAANTITANEIAANTITAAQIAAGTITATQIAAGTITASQIAAGTITATQIAAGTITADRLSVSTLSSITADVGTLTAGTISTNVLIAAESFTASNPVFTGSITVENGAGAPRVDVTSTTPGGGGGEVDLYDSADDFAGYIAGETGGILRLGGVSTGGVRIDSGVSTDGTPIKAIYSATITWNPGSISAGSAATTTVTVNGASAGDAVFATDEFQADDTNLKLAARVTAGNTVTLDLHNTITGGGAINPGSRTVRVVVMRF